MTTTSAGLSCHFSTHILRGAYQESALSCRLQVGDLQRIKEYPKLGFQIEQNIPDEVWDAWERLVALGYSKHLVK
jgi:hypothetical protein